MVLSDVSDVELADEIRRRGYVVLSATGKRFKIAVCAILNAYDITWTQFHGSGLNAKVRESRIAVVVILHQELEMTRKDIRELLGFTTNSVNTCITNYKSFSAKQLSKFDEVAREVRRWAVNTPSERAEEYLSVNG